MSHQQTYNYFTAAIQVVNLLLKNIFRTYTSTNHKAVQDIFTTGIEMTNVVSDRAANGSFAYELLPLSAQRNYRSNRTDLKNKWVFS
ncbi:MAG: hypothetical protein AB8F74_08645 [Saprospiraceae bacterium]